jgi:hypothetical protein
MDEVWVLAGGRRGMRQVVCIAAAFVLALAVLAAFGPAAMGEPADTSDLGNVLPASSSEVPMAEFQSGGRSVTGRIVQEDETTIVVETAAGGSIGYQKEGLRALRRYTVSLTAYYEGTGDYYHDRAWTAEEPDVDHMRARQAYRRALLAASTPEDQQRVTAKLEALAEDRQEWQAEAVRREEVKRAAQEAELARIQTELAQESLVRIARHEQTMRDMAEMIRRLQGEMIRLARMVENLEDQIEDLEDDIYRAYARDRVYVTNAVFVDLRNRHFELERRVKQLESRSGRH